MATKPVKVLPIATTDFEKFREQKLKKMIDAAAEKLEKNFSALCEEFSQKFDAEKWILMKRANQSLNVYYIHAIAGVMPDLNNFSCAYNVEQNNYAVPSDRWKFAGFDGDLPTETEMNRCFNDKLRYFRGSNNEIFGYWGMSFKKNNQFWYRYFVNNSYKGSTNRHGVRTENSSMISIPIYRFNEINSEKLPAARAILFWLQYELEPLDEQFSGKAARDAFKELKNFYRNHGEFLKGTDQGISLDRQKVLQHVLKGGQLDFVPNTKSVVDGKKVEGDEEFIKQFEKKLLECDFRRAALSPYGKNLLYGPNEGHWDLWDYGAGLDSEYKVTLKESFTARNPADDVSRGIVGIDFGTKSTVVVCESANHQQLPLQVGSGDYMQGINAANYENPTVMHFVDFKKFLADYNSRAGRPPTSWEDVNVSHAAFEQQKSSNSKIYYSFFDGLKHWCGTPNEEIKIKDTKGEEWNLPAFLNLEESQPNPIEIYAYYLGLYINNMIRGEIILSYIMSFPVTYDFEVREKIRQSFERGIKKSLPTALLSNEEAMKNFYVVHGASEPAAYAISALLGYNFDPEGDDENYYGVFDFGGGTTDFDFGVLKESQRQRYDYELKHFGANGDKTLGGENLLKLLAFEVFKANIKKLLHPNSKKQDAPLIPFTYAAERERFLNSESVINETSQEARANMHNLMEALRPVWENPDSEAAKKICNEGISLNLFDETGEQVTGLTLDTAGSSSIQNSAQTNNPAPKDGLKILNFKLPAPEGPTMLVDDYIHNNGSFTLASVYSIMNQLEYYKFFNLSLAANQWKALADFIYPNYNPNFKKFAEEFIQVDGNIFSENNLQKVTAPTVNPAPAKKLVDLQKILRDRIEKGIRNFFYSLKQAFESEAAERNFIKPLAEVKEFEIFLAGNSSKSKLVKEIFDDYIGENFKVGEILGIEKNSVEFKVFPPLGTPEAVEIQKQRGVEISDDPFEMLKRPTGKTGVAFGLLSCRESGRIEVSDIQPDEEAGETFQLYIGRQKKGKFKTLIDRSTKMFKWYEFLDDAGASFDILYTDVPEAATNKAPITISKQYPVRLEQTNSEAQIYIRPVAPFSIEYAVALSPEDLAAENFVIAPVRIDLK
ncbi:MAG: hypothetical protein IJT73_11450 [Selenomonadaceae bacterium]|nr:hypothetical protein [Selenomonadaceae bacterium]